MYKKNKIFKIALWLGDVLLMYGTLILALSIRYGDFSFLPGPHTREFVYHFSLIFIFWLLFLYIFNFYEIPQTKKRLEFIRNLLAFSILSGGFTVIYFYLRPEILIAPRTILVLHILLFSFFLYLWRRLFDSILESRNLKEKIIIIGFIPALENLIVKNLLHSSGYEIIAFFPPDIFSLKGFSPFSEKAKYGIISDMSKLKEIVEREGVTTAIFPRFFSGDEKRMQQIFKNLPFSLNYVSFADFYEFLTGKIPTEAISESWFLEKVFRSEKKGEELLKRMIDIFFSFMGVFITIILFPLIALAIKIDSQGPIFYSQKRIGKANRVFTIYKFRTMKKDAEKETGPVWTENQDKRITRVGQIMRVSHLDELPQMFNVLKGEISLVGPRPERPEFVKQLEKEIPYYNLRHLIRPGVTGWAQIHYPASTSIEEAREKFKYDLFYIKNRSLFLDIGIILKTIRKLLY